ncbi:unnamed protein product [Malus baccata var. baccata]
MLRTDYIREVQAMLLYMIQEIDTFIHICGINFPLTRNLETTPDGTLKELRSACHNSLTSKCPNCIHHSRQVLSAIYCKIMSIFPSLETTRSQSGIQTLCSLHVLPQFAFVIYAVVLLPTFQFVEIGKRNKVKYELDKKTGLIVVRFFFFFTYRLQSNFC